LQQKRRIGSGIDGFELFDCFNVTTEIVYGNELSLESFRSLLEETWSSSSFLIANYQRGYVNQQPPGGAHYSPLGAYNTKSDMVLILDVARYKYPPTWVPVEDLFDAINTTTGDGNPRGILRVLRPEGYGNDVTLSYSTFNNPWVIAFWVVFAILIVVVVIFALVVVYLVMKFRSVETIP